MFQGDIVWRGIIYTILMILGKLLTGLWLVRFDIRLPSISIIPSGCSPWSWLKRPTKRTQSTQEPKPSPTSSTPRTITTSSPLKPRSLYPASILGSAMVARGEIGFLISSLAESNGIFIQSSSSSSSNNDDTSRIYLVVTWAIMLCTVIGPVVVGSLVRRAKRLQARNEASGGPDPLGLWGVS